MGVVDISLVGIGSGDPNQLTGLARQTLAAADLVLIPRKGAEKTVLADLRRALAATVGVRRTEEFDMPRRDAAAPDYLDAVADWHESIADIWADAIAAALPDGGRVALMVWGDPSLYDSSLRIAERLAARGLVLRLSVVPGLTSLQMLTAAHAIPLNSLGASVLVTTGRRLRAEGWLAGVDTVAVMLDGGCAFQVLAPEGLTIWWGAYLGMADQLLIAGPLSTAGPEIVRRRAAARALHGWIMDTYLLRRDPAVL